MAARCRGGPPLTPAKGGGVRWRKTPRAKRLFQRAGSLLPGRPLHRQVSARALAGGPPLTMMMMMMMMMDGQEHMDDRRVELL